MFGINNPINDWGQAVANDILKQGETAAAQALIAGDRSIDGLIGNVVDTTVSVARRTAALAAFTVTSALPPEYRQALRVRIAVADLEPIPIICYPAERLSSKAYAPTPNIQFKTKSMTTDYSFVLYNANMEGIEDSKSAAWAETVVPGRFEPIATYANSSSRSFVIRGALFVNSESDADDSTGVGNSRILGVKSTLNLIRAMVFPLSESGAITSPPLWSVTIFEPGKTVSFNLDQVRVNSYNILGSGPLLANGMYAVYQVDINITEVVAQIADNGLYQFTNRDFVTVAGGGAASGALERPSGR